MNRQSRSKSTTSSCFLNDAAMMRGRAHPQRGENPHEHHHHAEEQNASACRMLFRAFAQSSTHMKNAL